MNEAVAYLGSSRESIQRFAKSGALPHGRVGSTFKFKQSDLDAWVMEQGLQRRQVLADRRAAK
jgi:excisionase family DNA binding protein